MGTSERLATKTKELAKANKTIKGHEKTIKEQDDTINAQNSYIHELEGKLKEREEMESLIVTENNGYITSVAHTEPFNVRIPYLAIQDIDLSSVTKKRLYRRFPFLQLKGNTIIIDQKQYKKYKGAKL